MARARGEPPRWWCIDLYSYTEQMPLEGWVWEFSRRSELKKILGDVPVDAMNPQPELGHLDLEKTSADYYYLPWPEAVRTYGGQRERLYRAPAVRFAKTWHGAGIQIPTPRGKWVTHDIAIDLNRRDTSIKRDFATLLNQIRIQENIPKPKEIKPRFNNWKNPLMVWDLYQYSLPLNTIAELLNISEATGVGPEWRTGQVINYHDTALRYIDEGDWENFARFI